MQTARVRSSLGVAGALAAVLFAESPALGAPTKDECIAAAEQAQPLRHDRRLRAARDRLLVCSQTVCPGFVRNDCMTWLADVEKALPSVVVRTVDRAGADVTPVKVIVDGQPTTAPEGTEIVVDPGSRAFRFEHAGDAAVEQQVVVREGERRRVIQVVFGAAGASAAVSETKSTTENAAAPNRTLPILLMAGGAVSLAAASYFWISGLSDRSSMESSCAPSHTCATNDVSSARSRLIVGDVLGVVGLALGGAGVYLFATRSPSASAQTVGRVPDGVMLGFSGKLE